MAVEHRTVKKTIVGIVHCVQNVYVTTSFRATFADRQSFGVVTFICPECEAATNINLETAVVPLACQFCRVALDEKAQAALSALAQFHHEASQAEEKAGKPLFHFRRRELQGS